MATLSASPVRAAGSLMLLVAGVSVLAVRPVHADQSLADVAKKTEEHRKTESAKPRVYTNKDLGAPPPGSTPDAPADAPAKAADTAADAKKAADKKADDPAAKDEAYWSGRLKVLTAQVERDTTF